MRIYIAITTILLLSFISLGAISTPLTVLAQDAKTAVCESLGEASTGDNCGSASSSTITDIVRVALNILSIIAGVIAVIMIIIAGLKFITSGGDPQSTASARNTIIYAAVGIVIVLLSQVIVNFVIVKATVPEVNKTQPKGS